MGPENQQESRREYTSMYPDSGCDLRCSHCTSLRPLIQKVVLGVVDLDAEIRQASVKTVVDRPSQSVITRSDRSRAQKLILTTSGEWRPASCERYDGC